MDIPSNFLTAPGGVVIPTDRLYHREHLWILPDPNRPRHARVGLSAYVCRWGIEVYFIEDLPALGVDLPVGGAMGAIETEKAALQLHAPFAGRVAAINAAVLADPSIITFDGYEGGWILELAGEPAGLLSPAEYLELLKTLPPPQCLPKDTNS